MFLEVPDVDRGKQWEVCLSYMAQHGLTLTAYATDPQAAASVVDHGDAACVVAAVAAWRGGEPACLAGKVRYVRAHGRVRSQTDVLDDLGAALSARTDVSQSDLQGALALLRKALGAPPKPAPAARTSPLDPRDGGDRKPKEAA